MPLRSSLTKQFALDHPIIGAPMAGGATTPELVAAVCNAGGIGFLACAYLQPAEIAAAAERVRRLTSRPFGANLFAPLPVPPADDATMAVDIVARAHARLGIGPPQLPASSGFDFESQLDAVLDSSPAAFSFTFGIPPGACPRARAASRCLDPRHGHCVDEAMQLERSGVDAIVAQGSEAGAHRGTFAADFRWRWLAPSRSCRRLSTPCGFRSSHRWNRRWPRPRRRARAWRGRSADRHRAAHDERSRNTRRLQDHRPWRRRDRNAYDAGILRALCARYRQRIHGRR